MIFLQGCVRLGMEKGKFVVNPTRKQLEKSPLNLVLTVGPNKNISKKYALSNFLLNEEK
jgi:hypothetical protein